MSIARLGLQWHWRVVVSLEKQQRDPQDPSPSTGWSCFRFLILNITMKSPNLRSLIYRQCQYVGMGGLKGYKRDAQPCGIRSQRTNQVDQKLGFIFLRPPTFPTHVCIHSALSALCSSLGFNKAMCQII